MPAITKSPTSPIEQPTPAAGPTVSYATMRKTILSALEHGLADTLLAEAEGQKIAGSSADAAEGGIAFLQKRKPVFKGQ